MYMNRHTGEIMTGEQAIHEYFKTPRNYLDNWTDDYIKIDDNEPTPNNPLEMFAASVNI